ncbi:hypothetical protein LCGC14_1764900 [marine sediment metagenome]|uniref:Uncharacterized protein n=1 Tax=marine sediment metagenome TaxID=412755 RepID=A0A0F9JEX3_9ZZZZ
MKRKITLRPADHPMFDGKTHVSFVPKRPPPPVEFREIEEAMCQTTPGQHPSVWIGFRLWNRYRDRLKTALKWIGIYSCMALILVVGFWMLQWVPCDQPTTLTWGHSHCELFSGAPNWILRFLRLPF